MASLNYSLIVLLAIITHLVINQSFYRRSDRRRETVEYRRYLIVILLFYIADAIWGMLSSWRSTTLLYYDTIFYYLMMGLSVLFCCRYVIAFLRPRMMAARLINGFGFVFLITEIVLLVVNHYHPLFFKYDLLGQYHQGPYRYAIHLVQVAMFAFVSALSIVAAFKSKGERQYRNMAMFLFGSVMTLALISQTFYPLLPLYSVGLMLGTIIIHAFIHEEEVMGLKDRLLNKQERISRALSIIEGLSHEYHAIWLIDKDTLKMQLIRSSKDFSSSGALEMANSLLEYDEVSKRYVDTYVAEADRDRMHVAVSSKVVLKQLEKCDLYYTNFVRRDDAGNLSHHQASYANAHSKDGKCQFVLGFRNLDNIMNADYAANKDNEKED